MRYEDLAIQKRILFCEEIETKVVPCISKEIAKSYFDFDKEEIGQLDNFQDNGVIFDHMGKTIMAIGSDVTYALSITEEEVKEKSAWEE